MIWVQGFSKGLSLLVFACFLVFSLSFSVAAQEVPILPFLIAESKRAKPAAVQLFPLLYFIDTVKSIIDQEAVKPYWVSSVEELESAQMNSGGQSILLNNDILAFYGHPNSKIMGILGRYSIEELDTRLTKLAAEYRAVSGGREIRKAFYIIYGTVWPKGDIGIIGDALLLKYIEYALKHNILIFIDHQIGRYHPVDAIKRMFPYLRYPNVHLALDPEWRTTKPMQEIGSVTAEEINQAQKAMEDYMVEHKIPGERLLVIHQFNIHMIKNRERVRTNFTKVRLVHCADGFGPPHLKRDSYAVNAKATNMPIKGFKLFYNSGIPGAGFDNPILTPKQVFDLNPRPYLIMYQ
ncbi:MAG: hypothetical protein LBH32_01830 [Dysgonamonadaceae bacterium]|jgi:hypothetical protein|nr:hypothetical protein [Dysgonamonadaceae bacterium]